ncbi:hypothetical protein TVAG_305770 [Trichomonas vaginalis G3]|uniref:Uncharacterized protein n=1 Tax=Trichomonas vaginalis (strain ATCC PRA-98 / G3) TaxID=412133 RepID=A2DN69_TRIV3|nr:hypothetical protein TVAGG3_1023690 [Trichomonas vaginalis G3]EAY18057.1 hypothetical protein TVAG_305770 [Trichomonas vaginalis G3]KAI5492322.1 hypothetical protein TVAGG3_1023690 [Trichomonas vaginalis G3]|eukprot:XP_001579043.1 hypothetical protein [Trichomonas vaginalis G3]
MKGVDYALEGFDFSGMKSNKLEDSKKRKIIRRCVIDAKANNITPALLNHYYNRLEHMRSLNSRLFGNITAPVIAQLDPPKPLKRCSPGKMYFIAANFHYFEELLRLNLQGGWSETNTATITAQPTPSVALSPISFSPQPNVSSFSKPQQPATDNQSSSLFTYQQPQQNFSEVKSSDFFTQNSQNLRPPESQIGQNYSQQYSRSQYMQTLDYNISPDFPSQYQNQYQQQQQYIPQQQSAQYPQYLQQQSAQYQQSYNFHQQRQQQSSYQDYQQQPAYQTQIHHQDCPTQQINYNQNQFQNQTQYNAKMPMYMPQQTTQQPDIQRQTDPTADLSYFDNYFNFDEDDDFFF